MGIRLVPNGNIGRWMERCRIAIPRALTGAITQTVLNRNSRRAEAGNYSDEMRAVTYNFLRTLTAE